MNLWVSPPTTEHVEDVTIPLPLGSGSSGKSSSGRREKTFTGKHVSGHLFTSLLAAVSRARARVSLRADGGPPQKHVDDLGLP